MAVTFGASTWSSDTIPTRAATTIARPTRTIHKGLIQVIAAPNSTKGPAAKFMS